MIYLHSFLVPYLSGLTKSNGTISIIVFESYFNRCLDGFEFRNASCFQINTEHLEWRDAKEMCDNFGGKLALVQDEETNTFVGNAMLEMAKTRNLTRMWVQKRALIYLSTTIHIIAQLPPNLYMDVRLRSEYNSIMRSYEHPPVSALASIFHFQRGTISIELLDRRLQSGRSYRFRR